MNLVIFSVKFPGYCWYKAIVKSWAIHSHSRVVAVPICPKCGRESDEGVSYCPYCGVALSTRARGKLAAYMMFGSLILLGVAAIQFAFAYHIGLWPAGWFWYCMGLFSSAIAILFILGANRYRHMRLETSSES